MTNTERFEQILIDIRGERAAQDAEWGGPTHDDSHNERDWAAFITVHLGRALEAKSRSACRRQLVRVAALAVAAVEWFDRMVDRDRHVERSV